METNMKKLAVVSWCSIILVLFFVKPITAATLTFDFVLEFSGATAPSGATPWISATFEDKAADDVLLTLTAENLSGTEFVSGWYFNIDPSLSGENLTITHNNSGVVHDSILVSLEGLNAGGSHGYDFRILFSTENGAGRFGVGDTASFLLGGIKSLSASAFNFISSGGIGDGDFLAAAHVQSIGLDESNDMSGWVAPIPIPSAILLLGSGLAGIGVIRRRKK